jgi:hypothetical protein
MVSNRFKCHGPRKAVGAQNLFERFAVPVLLARQTVTGAMSILRAKWDQTWSIVARAVARGKAHNEAQAVR